MKSLTIVILNSFHSQRKLSRYATFRDELLALLLQFTFAEVRQYSRLFCIEEVSPIHGLLQDLAQAASIFRRPCTISFSSHILLVVRMDRFLYADVYFVCFGFYRSHVKNASSLPRIVSSTISQVRYDRGGKVHCRI